LDLHFLHHPVAMGLDGAFGPADCAGNLLVGVAANDICSRRVIKIMVLEVVKALSCECYQTMREQTSAS